VVHNGRLTYGAFGVADVAEQRPISNRTNFYLASVTKPFTALAIHLLVRDGVLQYEDRLVRWIPELSATDSSITIHHLLTHSSGLADFYSFIDWPKFRRLDNKGVLDTTRAHPAPKFAPGTQYEYSNTGYVLLALIAERASGKSLGQLLADRVFRPSGMQSAVLYDDTTRRIPERAKAYERQNGRLLLSDLDQFELADGRKISFTFVQTGQGGLFATATDMAAWVTTLLDTTLLSARDKAEIFKARRDAKGQAGIADVRGVGYGWFVSERNGRDIFWHDGSRGGSRAAVALVPHAQLGVVVLSNVGATNPLELAALLIDRSLHATPRNGEIR
jgi:CubicO group peptidase (beta-lactamase class C family)